MRADSKYSLLLKKQLRFFPIAIFSIFREVSAVEYFVEKFGTEALKCRDEWGYTPAHWAALDGNIEIMRYLVECNAPVDLSCLGTQGPRPIHWACRKGHTAIVQLLLSVSVRNERRGPQHFK